MNKSEQMSKCSNLEICPARLLLNTRQSKPASPWAGHRGDSGLRSSSGSPFPGFPVPGPMVTAERTWQGLAWEVRARVAVADRDLPRARHCIAKAVSTVHGFEVPLAAWQAHATAAQIEKESANLESTGSHRDVSRATILGLANSLPEQEPLRKIFLSAPTVARVLNSDS